MFHLVLYRRESIDNLDVPVVDHRNNLCNFIVKFQARISQYSKLIGFDSDAWL